MIRRRRSRDIRFAESNIEITKQLADKIYAEVLKIGKEWDKVDDLCNEIMRIGHNVHEASSNIVGWLGVLKKKIKN